jgi:dGTPase
MMNVKLEPYAASPEHSKGRFLTEPECGMRSPHQRDRDRILHSTAFRRLEYKTQVFVNHEGDHYRTRLTHSLEVSQIARSLARALNLNEDLGETLALAHDMGHPPFGHAGEEGLQSAMQPFGGFDHNAQTLRIITKLEHRYADFDGLNLTFETLEGLVKHNGPLKAPLPRALLDFSHIEQLELALYPSLEAQLASLADDIAYHNHDIDDGIRAGLFTPEDLHAVPAVGAVFQEVADAHPNISTQRLTHEAARRLINRMCMDLLKTTRENIATAGIKTLEDVRNAGRPLVAFSPEMEQVNRALKTFLMERMYRHYRVNRMSSKAKRVIEQLFAFFLKEPECLPTQWRKLTDAAGTKQTAIVACDYIAGMTDRYALDTFTQIFEMKSYKQAGAL